MESQSTVIVEKDEQEEQAGGQAPPPEGADRWWRRLAFWRRREPTPMELALRAFDERSYSVALANYELALEQQPDSVEARRGMSLVLLHKGGRDNLQSALSHIQIALRLSPYRSGLYRIKSAIYSSIGLIERAKLEKHYAAVIAALSTQPEEPAIQNLAGIVMQNLRLPELAIEHFRHAIRLASQRDAYFRNLAIVLYRRALAEPEDVARAELLAGALAETLRALELQRTPASLLLLAMIYQNSSALDQALKTIEELERLEPDLPGIRRLKAEVLQTIEDKARYAVGDTGDPAVNRLREARNRVARIENGDTAPLS
jgi:tetratricopeptide (TPR) repeat protein